MLGDVCASIRICSGFTFSFLAFSLLWWSILSLPNLSFKTTTCSRATNNMGWNERTADVRSKRAPTWLKHLQKNFFPLSQKAEISIGIKPTQGNWTVVDLEETYQLKDIKVEDNKESNDELSALPVPTCPAFFIFAHTIFFFLNLL